jgi:hypothetical protein
LKRNFNPGCPDDAENFGTKFRKSCFAGGIRCSFLFPFDKTIQNLAIERIFTWIWNGGVYEEQRLFVAFFLSLSQTAKFTKALGRAFFFGELAANL